MQPGFSRRSKNSKLLKKRGVSMASLRRRAALLASAVLLCTLVCACGAPAAPDSGLPSLALRPAVFAEEGEGLLDLNTADETALSGLPGIGPVRAAAIVAYRQAHGPFTAVEELTAVPGIGNATLEKLRPRVKVSAD